VTGLTIDDIRHRATITVPEAARVCGISRDGAYRAALSGALPTLRLGRRIVVPVPRLLAMLGAGPTASGGDAA